PGGPGDPGIDPGFWEAYMQQQYGQAMGSPEGQYYAGALGQRFNPETGEYEETGSTGGLSAMMGPEADALRQITGGRKAELMATMPEGGQKEKALADLEQAQTGQLAQLAQAKTGEAAQALGGMRAGAAGLQTGYAGDVLGAGTQRYISDQATKLGMSEQALRRYLGEQETGLGWGKLGLETEMGRGGLGLERERYGFEREREGTRRGEFGQEFGERQRQFDVGQKAAEKASKRSFWGGLASGVMGAVPGIGGLFKGSDIRLKENITTAPGLSELRKIPVYSFDYNGKGGTTKGEHHIGVMAQDVEKVLPEAVSTFWAPDMQDPKAVDFMSILGLTVNAVKELDKRLKKKGK
ncbi:MAG: tail fiber domain-containing protein, partial [Nitrospiria bacterium]